MTNLTSITAFVLVGLLLGCEAPLAHVPKPSPSPKPAAAPVVTTGSSGFVLPETIGVEVVGGKFEPLIRRGTELPITYAEDYSTAEDQQTSVQLHVLAGE